MIRVSLLLPVFLAVSCASTQRGDRWDIEADQAQVQQLLEAHISYWESDRLAEAAQHYYQAPLWINDGWARSASDLDELSAIFEDQLVWLRGRDYDYTLVHDHTIHMLSPSSALATVILERKDERGNTMDPGRFAVTYVLIRTSLDWRITTILPHAPDRTPWEF